MLGKGKNCHNGCICEAALPNDLMAVLNQRQKKHNGRFYNVAVFLYLLHMAVMANLTSYFPDALAQFRMPSFLAVTGLLLIAFLMRLHEWKTATNITLFWGGLVAAALYSAAAFSDTIPYLKETFISGYYIKYVLLFSLIFAIEENPEKRTKQLIVVAVAALLTYQLGVLTSSFFDEKDNFEYMTVGFGCAPWWVIVAQGTIICRRRINRFICLLLSTYFAVFIAIYGNRGALLVVVLSVPLLMLAHFPWEKAILWLLFLTVAAGIVYGNLELVLRWAGDLLHMNLGNSRNLRLLSADILTYDSGRLPLYEIVIEEIKKSPLIGHGMTWDQVVIPTHNDAHNVFLQLCVAFGVLGALAYIALFYIGYKMLFKCQNFWWKTLFVPFYVFSIIRSLPGGSVWYQGYLYASLMVYFSYQRQSRRSYYAFSLKSKPF